MLLFHIVEKTKKQVLFIAVHSLLLIEATYPVHEYWVSMKEIETC